MWPSRWPSSRTRKLDRRTAGLRCVRRSARSTTAGVGHTACGRSTQMVNDKAEFTDAPYPPGAAPRPAHVPAQIGFRGSVGGEKTRRMGQRAVDVRQGPRSPGVRVRARPRAGGRDGRAPARRSRAGVEVAVYRGVDQPDPDAPMGAPRKMCRRADDAREVREAGGEQSDLCGSAKKGFCPHHPDAGGDCGSQAGREGR